MRIGQPFVCAQSVAGDQGGSKRTPPPGASTSAYVGGAGGRIALLPIELTNPIAAHAGRASTNQMVEMVEMMVKNTSSWSSQQANRVTRNRVMRS